jgi:hypothetical protein
VAIVSPSRDYRFLLAPGETLSVVTDAASSCSYGELLAQPTQAADVPSAFVAVSASSTITIGPKSIPSRWLVSFVAGNGVNLTQNLAQPVVQQSGAPADVIHLYGAGAPSGSTGQNHAAPGSLYTDTTNVKLYIQGGTKASPSWKIVRSA